MPTKIRFQKSGMGIEEATVLRWLKGVGERVTRGEVLLEMETAKAVQEILAPVNGTLIDIQINVGETAPANGTLGMIKEEHE